MLIQIHHISFEVIQFIHFFILKVYYCFPEKPSDKKNYLVLDIFFQYDKIITNVATRLEFGNMKRQIQTNTLF